MKKKYKLLLTFLAVASIAFSQNTLEQKDSIAKSLLPIDGKAIVYLLRPSGFGTLVKMNLECDSVHIGSTKAFKYVYSILEPGTHTFLSKAENKKSLTITLESGKIYYIKQEVKMGVFFAETGLKLLDEGDGKKGLGKCSLSKDNVFSN